MPSCIVVQCFCKPIETIVLLNSLHNCHEINQYNLLLYVDNAKDNSRFKQKNLELIKLLDKYKLENKDIFKSIQLIICGSNKGPYIGCYDAIEYAFTYNDFVIFTEDDIIFCKDTIKFYNIYRNSQELHNENCIGITSSSNYYYSKENIFSSKQYNIEVLPKYLEKINNIKIETITNNFYNKIIKTNWAPNKQMGLFKNGWDQIKLYRSKEFALSGKVDKIAPDQYTADMVNKKSLYFLYSIVPRSNDIGLFNKLGCTTLYYDGEVNLTTIKYLTSDNFDNVLNNLEIINTTYNLHNTII